MTPSCSPRQAGPKHALFDLERSISKFDLRSGQGQIMIQVRSICKSSEVVNMQLLRVQSFGTICAPLASSWSDLLAKNRLWPHLISGDLPVTPDRHLHPDYHRWGEWPWSWKNWVVAVGLCEMRNIFIFLHRLIMGKLRNWPDLRSPG